LAELLSPPASKEKLFMNKRPKSPSEKLQEEFNKATAAIERRGELEEENPSLASLLKGEDIDLTKRPK
jgi:hypothetical protein